MRRWRAILERLLLPPVCVLCGASGYGPDICRGCRADLPANLHACRTCALPLTAGAAAVCLSCAAAPPPWHEAFCAYRYEFPVDGLIKGLKFSGRLVNGHLLGQLLALERKRRRLARGQALPQCLVPVPLHVVKERARGYNQAAEIAGFAAALLGVPMVGDMCVRRRDTVAQTHLDAAARRRNVRGAFRVTARVAGRHLAVVDDVMTTGATVAALTEALLAEGARRVEVWTVARALGYGELQGPFAQRPE